MGCFASYELDEDGDIVESDHGDYYRSSDVDEKVAELESEIVALREAGKLVVDAWESHGYEENLSWELIDALDALAAMPWDSKR